MSIRAETHNRFFAEVTGRRRANTVAGVNIPQLQRLIVIADRGQASTVGTYCQAHHSVRTPAEWEVVALRRIRVVNVNGPRRIEGCNTAPVGTDDRTNVGRTR